MTEAKSPAEQLAEVQAKREALRLEREAKAAEPNLAAEMQLLTDEEELAKLQDNRLREVIETDLGLIAVVAPKHLDYQKFSDSSDPSYAKIQAFVTPCVVYPPAQRFNSMLEQRPGILRAVSDAVIRLASAKAVEKARKSS